MEGALEKIIRSAAIVLVLACAALPRAWAADANTDMLPDDIAVRQKAYLTKVEASAAEKFGRGTSDYFAALRQGLVRLGAAFQGGARGDATSFESMPAQIDRPALGDLEQGGLDKKTMEQIERDFDAAKGGARVVGGDIITTQSEFRDTVAFGRAGNLGCSGVVIQADAPPPAGHVYVLTAAHCVCALGLQTPAADNTKLFIGTNISDPTSFVALDLDSAELGEPDRPFVWMFPGSSCNGSSSSIRDKDLAVVRFKNNKPQANVRVATIATAERLQAVMKDADSEYRLIGFGFQRQQSAFGVFQLGQIGQKAFGRIRRGRDCTSSAGSFPRDCITGEEIILADSGNRVDTCAGDSGGPVYVRNSGFAAFRLAAITSRSTDQNGACGPGGIYGLVDVAAVTWIRNALHVNVSTQD